MKKFKKDWGHGSSRRRFEENPKPAKQEELFPLKTQVVPSKTTLSEHRDQFGSFLTEEGMMLPRDLPEDVSVFVKFSPGDAGMIILVDENGQAFDHKKGDPIYGQMWLSHAPECGGHMIQFVKASQGAGPLLYDIAMELMDANDSWLIPDRNAVSADATEVWEHYDKHRGDVEKEKIPLEADCSFRAAIKAVKYHQAEGGHVYDDWEFHPLAFKWKKKDHTIINTLKSLGKLKSGLYREQQFVDLEEDLRAKFSKKHEQVVFEMPLEKEEFVHFTTADRAQAILESGKLLMDPPHQKFGTDTVDAVSLTYGMFLPGVQTTHIPDREGQIVAIKFKTNTMPQIGFVEEVKWQQDVELIDPRIITLARATKLLQNAPEYKRVDKLDWGFVSYTLGK